MEDLVTRRIKAGMTLRGVAPGDMRKLFGVTDRTWRTWMREPRKYLTIHRLEMIAAKLRMEPSELIRKEDK